MPILAKTAPGHIVSKMALCFSIQQTGSSNDDNGGMNAVL